MPTSSTRTTRRTRTKVTYRKAWEREYPRTPAGRAEFGKVAADIESATRDELRRTGLTDDPPAREYLAELASEPTADGARVYTTAPRAHFVEYGTIYREPDAPMRTAARRFGTFRER
jgi:hypothetical protein